MNSSTKSKDGSPAGDIDQSKAIETIEEIFGGGGLGAEQGMTASDSASLIIAQLELFHRHFWLCSINQNQVVVGLKNRWGLSFTDAQIVWSKLMAWKDAEIGTLLRRMLDGEANPLDYGTYLQSLRTGAWICEMDDKIMEVIRDYRASLGHECEQQGVWFCKYEYLGGAFAKFGSYEDFVLFKAAKTHDLCLEDGWTHKKAHDAVERGIAWKGILGNGLIATCRAAIYETPRSWTAWDDTECFDLIRRHHPEHPAVIATACYLNEHASDRQLVQECARCKIGRALADKSEPETGAWVPLCKMDNPTASTPDCCTVKTHANQHSQQASSSNIRN